VTGVSLHGARLIAAGPAAALLAVLDRDGEEARIIGGAVRNALIGLPAGDIDIATTALPAEVTRRATAAGFRVVPTGIDHGTVTVVVSGHPFEVTTLREDIETDGRHAVVRFGRSWQADAERRDFTVNALSVTKEGRVVDLVGGLADLADRRIRFIGDADRRIAEDHLRILRFFRFHATYGRGALDAGGLLAAIRRRAGLDRLSRERVRAELLKLVVAPRAVPVIETMAETGFLDRVLAGVPCRARFARLVALEAVLGVVGPPMRRLAALAVRVPEDAGRLADRLRLSRAEAERLEALATTPGLIRFATGKAAARAVLYRLGPALYTDSVLTAWADAGLSPADPDARALAALPATDPVPRFPFKAKDLMARGHKPGPALGEALATLEAAWIAAGFPTEPDALEALLAAAPAPHPAT
jgi:tRNA nucleotidyltransferase/poly(A) polymerase